jgi:hypothetical protein
MDVILRPLIQEDGGVVVAAAVDSFVPLLPMLPWPSKVSESQ